MKSFFEALAAGELHFMGEQLTGEKFSALSTEDKQGLVEHYHKYMDNVTRRQAEAKAKKAKREKQPMFAKRHFEKLAAMVDSIAAQLERMEITKPVAEVVNEMVASQVGMMCALDNREFDSFRFMGEVRKRANRRRSVHDAAGVPAETQVSDSTAADQRAVQGIVGRKDSLPAVER